MRFRAIVHFYLFSSLFLFADQDYKMANEEESLFLRRIADFWQEGEYGITKKQIEEFLQTFPLSSFAEPLSIAMGDLFLREKNYVSALNYYSKITSPKWVEKTFLNRMQCLYYLEWYATLADECEAHLEKDLSEDLALKITYYLAISLYHQCLNTQKEPNLTQQLAKRAKPYFETLLNSELSNEQIAQRDLTSSELDQTNYLSSYDKESPFLEKGGLQTAQAFAHLCCILKEFSKAADIYLTLALKEPSLKEEMSFQAALIQAEFDKSQALKIFANLAKEKGKKAKEAAYNQMALLFETGQYETLLLEEESFLKEIPPDKKGMAYLFFGKSCLALKKYEQATLELKNFANEMPTHPSEALQSAFVSLMEASFQSDDLAGMNLALEKLTEINPSHLEISKGRFSRALLLKKQSNPQGAKEELSRLLIEFSQFPLRAQALFELTHLEYLANNWIACHNQAKTFLIEFPESELAPFAWRYLATSSHMIATQAPEQTTVKEQLVLDLTALLKQEQMFSQTERNDWQFFLAKAQFDLGQWEKAKTSLSSLLQDPSFFPQQPNAYLLLALCYRDEMKDLNSFCFFAEMGLEKKADLLEIGSLHISLFNAYLTLSEQTAHLLEKAAQHLYEAFEHEATITDENLNWLAAYYEKQFEEKTDPSFALRASVIYNHLLKKPTENIAQDFTLYKLAKLYSALGKTEKQLLLLNQLLESYPKSELEIEALYLLAEGYVATGDIKKAAFLFDRVAKTAPPIRSHVSAKAHLEGARLHIQNVSEQKYPLDHPETIQTLSLLKDLILQKTLNNEPIHLEAALDYIELKENLEALAIEKKIDLLKKIKADFENKEDLLSRDYHLAREKFPEKEKIYLGYLQLMDADILLHMAQNISPLAEQKELQAKGKDLLLEIIEKKAHPALLRRAISRLQVINEDLKKN